MYTWTLTLQFTNYLGDKVESYIPAFKSYHECMEWADIMWFHILSHTGSYNFIASCHWVQS